jgi:hypothetical protein
MPSFALPAVLSAWDLFILLFPATCWTSERSFLHAQGSVSCPLLLLLPSQLEWSFLCSPAYLFTDQFWLVHQPPSDRHLVFFVYCHRSKARRRKRGRNLNPRKSLIFIPGQAWVQIQALPCNNWKHSSSSLTASEYGCPVSDGE